ncbi:MAG: hypothetical protein IJ710_02290 [Prevotella sp.]|nr:hypothetical protein [Prevotella sp.]
MRISKNTNISIALGLLACIIAVGFRLFSEADLWFQMFSAILGVIITIIITNLLLNSQTDNDIERERNSEIFREKLKIYQEYLQALYDVLKEERITPDEALRLQFQTSYIAMHTDSAHIREISEHVSTIVQLYSERCGGAKERLVSDKDLLQRNLFAIVEIFRKELYREKPEFNPADIDAAVTNFSYAYSYFLSCENRP